MKRITPGPVKTCAVGYGEEKFSELSFARRVAQHIGTEHHEVRIGMAEFFNTLPSLVWHEDEPISWPSSVALYYVSRPASQQVKVVLTGEGSDELFGGYARYGTTAISAGCAGIGPSRAPSEMASENRSPLRVCSPAKSPEDPAHTARARGQPSVALPRQFLQRVFQHRAASLLRNPDSAETAYQSYLDRWEQRASSSPRARMLFADQKTYLVELLMKQDQMSMAASME